MSNHWELLLHSVEKIYQDILDVSEMECLANDLLQDMRLDIDQVDFAPVENLWDERDLILITYADTFLDPKRRRKPLQVLQGFLDTYCRDVVAGVHILPFYPYSSDDGFAVIDYASVNESVGDWDDVATIANDYRVMGDLVINHASSRSIWFQNFLRGRSPGAGYFLAVDTTQDWRHVVRPRTSPLFREVQTAEGERHVWCTFSHDQVDFDFRNPQVLREFVRIIRLYLDRGVEVFRLDAVAFLWKEAGTGCINLEQTHAVVRLLRLLTEWADPRSLIITETNIPSRENLSYFGNGNEAHCVYNFSLPPLLVNTLITGNSHYLTLWLMGLPPLQSGTTYFNFIASHDGIGLRPAEGILSDAELDTLIATMQQFGGTVSWRALGDGREEKKAYEINIALFDALQGTTAGADHFTEQRFLCAHAVMLGLEGIPGLYVHSLLATRNDYHRMEHSGHNRAINRHQWDIEELDQLLESDTHHRRVYRAIAHLIRLRCEQAAFHPNASQLVLHLGDYLFGYVRQSQDLSQRIYCVSNICADDQSLCLSDLNSHEGSTAHELITGQEFDLEGESITLSPYQTVWLAVPCQ
jgi:sucrose phosphorylase